MKKKIVIKAGNHKKAQAEGTLYQNVKDLSYTDKIGKFLSTLEDHQGITLSQFIYILEELGMEEEKQSISESYQMALKNIKNEYNHTAGMDQL